MASLRMVVFGCVLAGCGPVVDAGDGGGDDTTGGEETRGDTMTTATTTATTASTTASTTVGTTGTTTASTSFTTTAGTVSATDPTASDVTTVDPSDTDTDGHGDLPNGSMCVESFECASGHCYVVGILGGICGECENDFDCPDGGCTLPNFLSDPPIGSLCNDGSYGDGCETDEVCSGGLVCATTVNVPGVVTVSTCSECQADADCETGSTCEPDIALAALTGVKRCVIGGTLANGQSCDFESGGDLACGSGHCAVADIMGLLLLGVCSSCETDQDCVMPQVCEAPQADLGAGVFIPGGCG